MSKKVGQAKLIMRIIHVFKERFVVLLAKLCRIIIIFLTITRFLTVGK